MSKSNSMCTVTYPKTKANGQVHILCQPESVNAYRMGKISLNKCLLTSDIYSNPTKGDLVQQSVIDQLFPNCSSRDEVLQNGEFPLTTHEMREIKEQCFRSLVGYIVKNYSNVNGNSYSPSIVEEVLKTCKVNVDVKQSAITNFNTAKKKIQGKIVLKPRPSDLEIVQDVSWANYYKVKADIKSLRVKIIMEQMTDTGYTLTLQVPADSMDRLNHLLDSLN